MLNHMRKRTAHLALQLAAWVIRLAAKPIDRIGRRLWLADDRFTEAGNKVVRCATRLRIRAYEMQRRNQ